MRVENNIALSSSTFAAHAKLETAFLEEMMKYISPPARNGEFSGGMGEQQFSSFLNAEYAAALSRRIDLGLNGEER